MLLPPSCCPALSAEADKAPAQALSEFVLDEMTVLQLYCDATSQGNKQQAWRRGWQCKTAVAPQQASRPPQRSTHSGRCCHCFTGRWAS